MTQVHRRSPVLDALVDLFYTAHAELGEFREIPASEVPDQYRLLLDHHQHMTVTVERFHGCPVDVQVVQLHKTDLHYSRKILLTRQSDGEVVQFGIVRLCLDYLAPAVRREVESQDTPLGRILIEHNVLREVQLISLWEVAPGDNLRELFGLDESTTTYGRTALIYCNGIPAVELLEIVAPV